MPKRVNIRISDSLDTWFKIQSEDMGIPKSAMMAMALQQFAIQYQTVSTVQSMNDLIGQFNEIEMENKKLKGE